MSLIIGASNTNVSIAIANDQSIHDPDLSSDTWNGYTYGFGEGLWRRSRPVNTPNQLGSPAWEPFASSHGVWDWMTQRTGGGFERTQMFGQTLDQNSNAVANAVVSMLDVPTGAIVDTFTTDAGGNYFVGNPYGAGRGQAIAQRSGSPDVAGASDNNLP